MKRNLTRLLALPVVVCLLMSIGCVNRELQAAKNANALLRRRFDTSEEARNSLAKDNEQLQRDLTAQGESLETRRKENELLIAQLTKSKEDFDKLTELYEKEVGRKVPIFGGPLDPTVDKALKALAAANPDLFTYDSKLGMVKLKSDLTFGLGSAVVQAGASQALGKLVAILKTPEAARYNVYVAGHTDDVPIGATTRKRHPTNWYLSVHRAVGVQKVLVAAGMPDARIGVLGFGEFHPVAPNAPGNKGNAANRRVELWILPPGRLLTRPMAAAAPE